MAPGVLYGLAVVFGVIGGLELVDRTSFALIALAARSRGLGTWVGGAAAFVTTTVLAVAVGAGLAGVLGPAHVGLLRAGGGAFLIGYAVWVLRRPPEEDAAIPPPAARTALATAFTTILLLELGDTTMIFEVVFVANFGWAVVLLAGAGALVVVAAWDVWIGRRLALRLSPATLRRVVGSVLIVVGVVTVAYGLFPAAFPAL